MSRDEKELLDYDQGDGFVSRWSRLKQAAGSSPPEPVTQRAAAQLPAAEPAPEPEPLTDADMPPLESLDESSDYSGFLSEQVSEALRRQALQKLFHLESFNVCDGLDDYADDFTSFTKLGDIITADMRHQMAMAEERLKAALQLESDESGSATAAAQTESTTGQPVTQETISDGQPDPQPGLDQEVVAHHE